MGIICELYAIEKSIFNNFREKPKAFEVYLYENYGDPNLNDQLEGGTFFYLDKAWDIAMFLLKENDSSDEKIVSRLKGNLIHEDMDGYRFVTFEDIKLINKILVTISDDDIKNAYNVEKMTKEEIYNAGWFTGIISLTM